MRHGVKPHFPVLFPVTVMVAIVVLPLNFAFLTRGGTPQAPANPLDSTVETFTPNLAKDLFMNSAIA